MYTTKFRIQTAYMLPTDCIYLFHVINRRTRDYCSIQHEAVVFDDGKVYLLRGMK